MAWTYTSPSATVVAGTSETLVNIPAGAVVSSILLGTAGSTETNIRNIGTNRLVVAGTLDIAPEYNQIIASGPVVVQVPSGGRLNINGQYGTYFSQNKWLHMTGIYNFPDSNMVVGSGGRLDWTGGAAFFPGGIILDGGAIVNIKNAIIDSFDFDLTGASTPSEQQIRQSSLNCSIDGLTLYRGFFTIISIPLLFKGYKPRFCSQALAFSGATPDVDIPIFGFDTDGSSNKDVAFHVGCRPVLTAPVNGSALMVSHNGTGINPAAAYGLLRVFQPVRVTAKIGATGISGIAYMRDTNNGNRRDYSSRAFATAPFVGTTDRVYVQPITAGTSAQFDVLTAAVAINDGTSTVADSGLISTGVFRIDFRGKENNSTDKFDLVVWAYTAQIKVTEIILKGKNGDANLVVVPVSDHLVDTDVTLTQAQAAALVQIGNLDQLYDAAKNWKCQAQQTRIEYPTALTQVITSDGTTLDLGNRSLVIDGTAATAFAINTATNTITIKSVALATGTKFKTLTTTGTVTFVNGGATSAVYTSSAGTSAQLNLTSLSAGSQILLTDGRNTVIEYVANSNGTYTRNIAPGATGTWTWRVARYGFITAIGTFTPNVGGLFGGAVTLIPDTFVVDALANVQAYTDLNTTQRIYDRLALYGTTQAGMLAGSVAAKGFGTLTVPAGLTLDPAAVDLIAVTAGVVTAKTSGLAEDATIISTGAFTQGTSTLSNAVEIRANNLDSELVFVANSITLYPTAGNRDAGTSAGPTSSNGIIRFKFGAVQSGVTMSGAQYSRVNVGVILLFDFTLVAGANLLDLGTSAQLAALSADLKTKPTLTQIESSTVLAKEATVSTRLSASAYVAPANAEILLIKTKTDLLLNPPTVFDIKTALEADGSKLDSAMRAAKAARLQTL
jgi:hypothetical protein